MRTFSSVGTADPTTGSRRTRGLPIFFGIAFSLSWLIVGIIVLLVGRTSLPAMAAVTLFLFGPLLAAFGASAYEQGRAGVYQLLAQCGRWRAPLRWYAIALAMPALIVGVSALLFVLLGGPVPPAPPVSIWLSVPLLLLTFVVLDLMEQIGWRGYALPRLQPYVGALPASVMLGVLHARWHLPLYFIPGAGFDTVAFPVYVVITTALSVLFTWVYNNTRRSLLLVGLMHAGVNVWMSNLWGRAVVSLPPETPMPDANILFAVALTAAAIVVAVGTDWRTLIRRG
jgi:uncharacterized protein